MWPLTKDIPKSLLPLGDRPAIDYIIDKLLKTDIDEIIVYTNLKFKPHFNAWLKKKRAGIVQIAAEASKREEEKLGAVGALAELASKLEPDDYLIVAGDNIFTSDIASMIHFYMEKRATTVAIIKAESTDEVLRGSSVILRDDMTIAKFVEKPAKVESMLIAACVYILPHRTLLRTKEYIQRGGDRDEAGSFMSWLSDNEAVYGYMLPGRLWDIGTVEGYERLKRHFGTHGSVTETRM